MKVKDRLVAWLRSAGVWFNAILLAVFPFADEIMRAVNDNMPALSVYLPPNVYKAVGIAVVLFNLVRSAQRAHRAGQGR